jgi:hypothetical protein
MLDALLSFTKAVCKSCFGSAIVYTPATGRLPGQGNPIKAMNCQEILDFKKLCKYYKLYWLVATFSCVGEKDT